MKIMQNLSNCKHSKLLFGGFEGCPQLTPRIKRRWRACSSCVLPCAGATLVSTKVGGWALRRETLRCSLLFQSTSRFGRRAAPPSGSLVGGCCWADSNSEVIGRGGSSMLTAVFRRVLVRGFLWLTYMLRVLLVHMQKLFVVYDTFTQFRSATRTAGFL